MERRYLEHLARTLDEIELFGLRVANYRPRATFSVAYIGLTATAEDRRGEDVGPLKTAALTGDQGAGPAVARRSASRGRHFPGCRF